MDDHDSLEAAVEELEGIVEAGGNGWNTKDGNPPKAFESAGYEIALAMEVTGFSDQDLKDLELAAEVMSA